MTQDEDAPMTAPAAHWDPFGRAIPAQRHRVQPPRGAIRFPAWATPALVMLALAGTLWLIGAGVFGLGGVLWPAVLLAAGIGGVLLVDILGKGRQSRLYRYFRAAEALGWSFRLAPAHVPGAPGLSGNWRARNPGPRSDLGQVPGFIGQALARAEASRREAGTVSDTEAGALQAVYRTIPELFRPRPGQPVAMTIEAEFWGETSAGVPFWLAVREAEMNTTLAARDLKSDAHGNTGDQGALLMMVAAYGLDRDTGIRAVLLAEALGDSGGDLKTESTEFNRRYRIAARDDDPEAGMHLMQALTPATQTSLLDLWDRYRMQAVIDGAVVYVAGYERINTSDDEVLTRSLARAAEDFAAAATRFKRYVE